MLITPTEHEKNEWSRLAQAAYAADFNAIGHRYSAAASLCRNCDMPLSTFDSFRIEFHRIAPPVRCTKDGQPVKWEDLPSPARKAAHEGMATIKQARELSSR